MKESGRTAWRALAIGAIAASVGLCLSGCSDINFPAVHDMPAARTDITLTPDQVKQATDQLNCERQHLQGETQGSGQVTGSTGKAVPVAQQTSSSCTQPAAMPAVATQPASAYARP